jgi:hypothetical protein
MVKKVECGTGLCLIEDSLSEKRNLNNSTKSELKSKLFLLETGYLIILIGEFVPCPLLAHLLTSKKSL